MINIFNLLNKKIDCFVIFAVPRSGSNLLCGCLNSHPEIICHHELFHPDNIYYSLDHRNNDFNFSVQTRDKNPEKFIAHISREKFGKKIAGFKMMPGHNKRAEDFILKNKNIKKIILSRENKIKTFVSLKIAEKTKCFSVIKNSNNKYNHTHREKIHITYEELEKFIKSNESYYEIINQYLTKSRQNYFSITYEDFALTEGNLVKEELLKFLNVDPNPNLIRPRHIKQNPDDLSELIENFDEIKVRVEGTSLEKFLI